MIVGVALTEDVAEVVFEGEDQVMGVIKIMVVKIMMVDGVLVLAGVDIQVVCILYFSDHK